MTMSDGFFMVLFSIAAGFAFYYHSAYKFAMKVVERQQKEMERMMKDAGNERKT